MIRQAEEQDASSLAAVSIEVWLNTYLRDGVSPFFADYVLSEFTAQKFRDAVRDPNMAIWVSENLMGIDGFVAVSLVRRRRPHFPIAHRWKSQPCMFSRDTSRVEEVSRCCIVPWITAGAWGAKAPV